MSLSQTRIILILSIITSTLRAQNPEIERLMEGELKMAFPSIYFKHQSANYAVMPYTADSCFKYIALHFDKNVNSLVIWRDSAETEKLTDKRVKKIIAGLKKYLRTGKIEIYSMNGQQKISRRTIRSVTDSAAIAYLMTLNSVFDFSRTRLPVEKSYSDHIRHPSIFCGSCWKNGFHLKTRRKLRKMDKHRKQEQLAGKEKEKT